LQSLGAGPPRLPPVTLILGGARSGKSRYAERLVEGVALSGIYCATAEARDAEMAERIAAHRARRGAFWRTIETPLALPCAIAAEAAPARPVLVDCLTLWLSNLLLAGHQPDEGASALCGALRAAPGPVVLVSNEVGMGLVPETPLDDGSRSLSTNSANWASTASCCSAAARPLATQKTLSSSPMAACAARLLRIFCRH